MNSISKVADVAMTLTITPVMALVVALVMALAVPDALAQADAKASADCMTSATTQARMNECGYEDFLAANAAYAEASQAISGQLSGKQRDLFRRAQKSWLAYRTAVCDFESSGLLGGSAQGLVKWQCTARMTRAHVDELRAMGDCVEGDLACVRLKK